MRSVGRSVSPELLMYFQSPMVVSYSTYSGARAARPTDRRVRAPRRLLRDTRFPPPIPRIGLGQSSPETSAVDRV